MHVLRKFQSRKISFLSTSYLVLVCTLMLQVWPWKRRRSQKKVMLLAVLSLWVAKCGCRVIDMAYVQQVFKPVYF